MSEKQTLVALLRGLITEMITVAVEQPAGEGQPAKPLKVYELSDDDGDELEWFLGKYGRPTWKTRTQQGEKVVDPEFASHLDSVVDRLVTGAEDRDLLKRVIAPWKQVGLEALERILTAQERTGKPFPFFSGSEAATPGGKLSHPAEPTPAVVKYLFDTTTRIGNNDTGKGELLLALLTGGVAGGKVGDLNIGGTNWEVKDTPGVARLGDDASNAFDDRVRAAFSERDEVFSSLNVPSADAFLKRLSTAEFVRGLSAPALDRLTQFAQESTDYGGALGGFIISLAGTFKFLPVSDARFAYRSGSGRLHVSFATISGERTAAAAQRKAAAEEKKFQAEADKAARAAEKTAARQKKEEELQLRQARKTSRP